MHYDTLNSWWRNPPAGYRPAPFWSWNAKLDPQRLTHQVEVMKEGGMGGFFMHSRYGLKTEYLGKQWFECVSACIEKARQLGVKAYLYDEDRWPSGIAGGIITRANKGYRLRHLVVENGEKVRPFDVGEKRLGIFAVEMDGSRQLKSYRPVSAEEPAIPGTKKLSFTVRLQEPLAWQNDGTYLDTMNAQAVGEFIRVTHEVYAQRYQNDFGGVIPAIFTDEPNYGHIIGEVADKEYYIPWTADMLEEFRLRRGYDLREFLPELTFTGGKNRFSKVRHDYYRTVTELFVENYTRQIGQWCLRHHLPLTGHVLQEQTLASQIGAVGACMPNYEYMQWPGVDILCDQTRELATVKQCGSVADQLGKERVLSELFGCTGWDWPLEGHKFMADWQFALGVNFLCPHLTHYSLAGGAKRDYPASIRDHSPWWKYYHAVNDYLSRTSVMLTQGRPLRDVLVIHPIESAWGLFSHMTTEATDSVDPLQKALDTIIFGLTGEHYDWDFADESLLARYGQVSGGDFVVGRMSYKLVVVPPLVTLRSSTTALLRQFADGGGMLLFIGATPQRIEGLIKEEISELISRGRRCGERKEEFIATIESLLPRRVSICENGSQQNGVWAMLRQVDGAQMLFVQSHDRRNGHRVKVCVASAQGPVVRWNALTGEKTTIPAAATNRHVEFDLDLDPTGSGLITLGMEVPDVRKSSAEPKVAATETLEGPFAIELTEPNTFPLDYCRYRFAQEGVSELLPTLKVDELLRRRFGRDTRFGLEQQPWYLLQAGKEDTELRGAVQMCYSFHVTELPGRCRLALENPQNYRITVNGHPAGAVEGHWIDDDIQTIDITADLQCGTNEVQLDFNYRLNMELEDLYLVGDFGVRRLKADEAPAPGNMTMVSPPAQLHPGSWVGQGLDFYGAAVGYKITVARPPAGRRVRIRLPEVSCTAAAVHVGPKTFTMLWAPFSADITEALSEEMNEVVIEVIGGRKNILGPMHVPWQMWTGPFSFNPNFEQWTFEYQLTDHGLLGPVLVETLTR